MAPGGRRRRRRGGRGHELGDDVEDDAGEPEVDLHALHPDAAVARLGQAVHAARVRGASTLLVVTGAGWGNRRNEPVLRTRVEDWCRGEGRERGVEGFERTARGGALRLRLRSRGAAAGPG